MQPPTEDDGHHNALVLLVEDDEGVRRVLRKALLGRGYRVETATNGREALGLLSEHVFDVVVSDINMPELNGIQLLRAVRAHDLELPVLLMTGAPDVETASLAVELGAQQYLLKPIDLGRLERGVERALLLRRLARLKLEALALSSEGSLGAADRAGLEATFERALAGLWIAYQPIVDARTRKLFGYEALLRSTEPRLPHPGAILDAAERLGRLESVGRRVRELAPLPLAQAPAGAALFVNLHATDLLDERLYDPAAPLTEVSRRVVLELTERAALDHIPDTAERIARLRALGFRIAVDDLGAGYAGLTSFAQLEPEVVKLDLSIVRGIDSNSVKQKLVRAMVGVCHDMDKLVVAEGVETSSERAELLELGCDLLQGFLLARPGRAFPEFTW